MEHGHIIGIYHKGCIDGTTAAAVLLKKFPTAQVFPLSHGFKPEDIAPILELISEETVFYTLDCTLGAREAIKLARTVIVLDHHAGAQDEMRTLASEHKRLTYYFDNNKSGATLAWAYLFPHKDPPEILLLVQDQDLWRWQFGERTKFANNYLSTLTNKPEDISALITDDKIDEVVTAGRMITHFTDHAIAAFTERAEPIYLNVGAHFSEKVRAYNSTEFQSEIANKLLTPDEGVVIIFKIKGQEVKMSIRSLEEFSPSALDVATALGGSGHRNSSGARVSLAEFIKMIE